MATAWLNLFELAALQPGERVLLKAGGSGVGTAAIQLCKAMGNPVFVQVGSDDKLQRCIALGADGGFNRHHQSLIDLKSADPFDVVLDPVVGESLADTLKLLNTNGRLVVIGLLGGRYASVDFGRLLMKRLQIIGSTLRSQPIAVKGQLMQQLQDKVWPLLAAREVQPVIDSIMSIHEVEQAHQRIAANENFGKIVLRIEG
jgi:NADPH:quinone reductase-like Zn-dependent oxidoreductase